MKSKFFDLLKRYLLIVFSFLPAFILIRIAESLSLIFQHSLSGSVWIMELHGLMLDWLVLFSFAIPLFILFLLISLLSRKTGKTLAMIILMIYLFISLSLTTYFTKTLVPLDQVIFFFSPLEIFRIIISSTRISVAGVILFLLVLAVPVSLYFFTKKLQIRKPFQIALGAVVILSPVLFHFIAPNQLKYNNDIEYFARSDKMEYLVRKIYQFKTLKNHIDWNGKSYDAAIQRYHAGNPEFSYIRNQYPLLHTDNTPDVLGQFFNFNQESPNIVFLVVESLSTSFCGEHPFYGRFMPFLDSLMNHSLYWQNCLATSERTFNVLPAIFGSLPFSNENFRVPNAPLHFSMIRYLNENGYSTQYFYGGDPYMGGTQSFLEHEQIDYILPYFGKSQEEKEKAKLFEWGDYDGIMFKRAFHALDSMNIHAPRLDIFQTLTMHAPFTVPDDKYYSRVFDESVAKQNLSQEIKRMVVNQKNIFQTILYTDESLRQFFNYYKKRKDFNNTIFVITGDHAMPELSFSFLNLIEKYHVPLAIYSPMLKKPSKFESVSSHLDLTPSILAMLRSHKFVKTRPICHWLGTGLDVSQKFENTHNISFIQNSRNQDEYIKGNYFVSFGRLFKLLPGMKTCVVNNPKLLDNMERDQKDYLFMTNKIKERESLIPDDILYYDNYEEEPYYPAKPINYGKTSTNKEFLSMINENKIDKNYKMIGLEVIITPENGKKNSSFPAKLVFQILDDKSKSCIWYQFPIEDEFLSSQKTLITMRKCIDLSSIKDLGNKTLRIYLYNPDHKEYYFDKLDMVLTGYKFRKS
ncbi:MAG: sulfatase-like hydrolase/transferase [Bacteroidota bacterium]|nr:sulfatase-like hydrolase/transferase [Bacteroidota bacterium]